MGLLRLKGKHHSENCLTCTIMKSRCLCLGIFFFLLNNTDIILHNFHFFKELINSSLLASLHSSMQATNWKKRYICLVIILSSERKLSQKKMILMNVLIYTRARHTHTHTQRPTDTHWKIYYWSVGDQLSHFSTESPVSSKPFSTGQDVMVGCPKIAR